TATTLSRTTFDARLKRSGSAFFLIVAWNVPSRWRTMRNAMPPRFRRSSTQPAMDASLPWSAGVIVEKDRNGVKRAVNEPREKRLHGWPGCRRSSSRLPHDDELLILGRNRVQ